MKKMLSLFLLASTFCFSYSNLVMPNLDTAYDFFEIGRFYECEKYLGDLINDEKIPALDKVHYLYARFQFYKKTENIQGQIEDWSMIKHICIDDKCREELYKYYQIAI